jgi:acyl carrier protein
VVKNVSHRPHATRAACVTDSGGPGAGVCLKSRSPILAIDVMDVTQEVLRTLDEVLSLKGRALGFGRDDALLGAIPELDSMAVVTVITTLEERFGIVIDDDEIDGDTFANVGSLADFVARKVAN